MREHEKNGTTETNMTNGTHAPTNGASLSGASVLDVPAVLGVSFLKPLFAAALLVVLSVTANALPLVWRADWPGAKPVETLVHRGTDIEFQPQWYINGEPANSTNWTFTTFVQTNAQATGEWFGPLPGAAFSHTNDIGAAFYNVMVRAQMPGGGVNYTAFARLRMLDSPGFTPGELHLPVAVLDFAQVEVRNAEMIVPDISSNILATAFAYTDGATNALGQAMATADAALSAATATNAAAIAANSAAISTNSAAISTNATAIAGVRANLENNYYTASETDEAIDALAAYYITATAQGAAFATYAALTNATVYYSAGAVRVPTRNDYCVVLADETHGGAEWRYIYAVADGATTGQWEAQYPIETNDYEALSNKPSINGHVLTNNQTGAALGLLDLSGGTMTGILSTSTILLDGGPTTGVLENRPQLSNSFLTLKNGSDLVMISLDATGFFIIRGNLLYYFPSASGTLALDGDIAAAATAATNYTDAALTNAITPSNPTFSNAVLSVGIGIDTNTVAAINALVEQGDELPIGGATTVGALLLALAAAIAALKRDKANASDLRYAISESIPLTVTSGAAATTLDDRTHNVRTVAAPGSGNTTTITAMLPPIVQGKSRDMFLNLTVGSAASDAGDISLSIIEPSGATVQIDIGSVEDIGVGKNEILISENALPTTSGNVTTTHWLVTVRHEDFT